MIHGEPLRGGKTSPGVVRIGDTVRRPPVPNSPFVRALLLHLERVGFDGVPRHLGTDEEGRDTFTFLDGDVPHELIENHSDAVLEAAAGLIRRFHDATRPLVSPAAGFDVVCHNDLGPCNTVFRNGMPVALIDFDWAMPGTRVYDLGHAVWLWLDLGNDDLAATDQRRRLGLFLSAYGPDAPSEREVIESVLRRQTLVIAEGIRRSDAGMTAWATACRDWTRSQLR